MATARQVIGQDKILEQEKYMDAVLERHSSELRSLSAKIVTFGCQQNEADSDVLRGMVLRMGYALTEDEAEADLVVVNTCAVREHAEMRILGNVGALTHTKKANRRQIIALCGCMVQQQHMADKIRDSYKHVDIVFGSHSLWRFPELLYEALNSRKRLFLVEDSSGAISEGLPVARIGGVKAWLSVMYGCNNFCSYCVVPHVRGRERSRLPEIIIKEAEELVADGVRDITLLGQNVNSYGGDVPGRMTFPSLLTELDRIPGDFLIRFMTSHPKDAGEALFDAMANSTKCARHIHLPAQSGSDRVLKAMNRGYTSSHYRELAALARRIIPDLVLTSDIIVGFPGETEEEFEDTLRLVQDVAFDSLFTFIFSKRQGTPAFSMPDPVTKEEKQARFNRLVELQNAISERRHSAYLGRNLRVLVDGVSEDPRNNLNARTNGGRLVHLSGPEEYVGKFADVRITSSSTWALFGEIQ